ncbi:hypothetical protein DM01DRAFT_322092 [Hesseltinella vesiculosa]|uniref:Uncharacterized protein n=1 Tax=Hesseltinella vesiculosa TaxID=101127 RepID=A0A1X2GL14_9FUNG|nr:hypothetical protein DM01DRAFT_322092 [Hesseltinella vesiculosa]
MKIKHIISKNIVANELRVTYMKRAGDQDEQAGDPQGGTDQSDYDDEMEDEDEAGATDGDPGSQSMADEA